MAVHLIKPALVALGAGTLFATSYYLSTQVGLQSEGWHEVTVEMPRNPGYAAVGQSYFTPDGSKVLVTAATRQDGKHQLHAKVQGTHRYAVALFPVRLEHSFAMDTPSLEWTLRQASGQTPAQWIAPAGRQWHVLN
ncbi:hypothetical protein OKA05_18135 [Luteolibacter arcticus]|uniref:Uncharacterized protein n=1 Tax=Luteolibacter arcticus TaxID=1581411 RepID=A0ABT3GLZ7_9BACT|nr:hypothetical protein [Luteolibacter arcticus]MCW1924491.1 hypothetical protein [Luteolibacter arcticus]